MEYAGYVRRGAPDIGKAVGDIATQLRAVEAGREKRRCMERKTNPNCQQVPAQNVCH